MYIWVNMGGVDFIVQSYHLNLQAELMDEIKQDPNMGGW